MDRVAWLRSLARRGIAREFSWIGAGRLSTVGIRLVGIRVLTELVEPSVFGVVGLTIGVAILARNVLCAPVLEATFRFFADASREGRIADHRALLGGILRIRAALAAGALLVGGVGWGVWRGSDALVWSFVAVAALTALETLRFFELRLLNASRRQGRHASWTVLDEVLRPGCAAAMVLAFGSEAVWVLTGYALGVAASTAVFWSFRVRGDATTSPEASWAQSRRAEVVHYALPLSFLAIVGWLNTFADRYVLAGLAGTASTGIYVAAYSLASQPFVMTAQIFALTFRPPYNDAAVTGDLPRERRILLLWSVLLSGVLFGGVALMTWLAEPLTGLLLAADYADASALLPWIGAAYALQGCKQVFDAIVYATKRTGRLVVAQLCAATVSLALYFVLIPSLGALGAAVGTLGGMAVSLVVIAVLSGALRRFRISPGERAD